MFIFFFISIWFVNSLFMHAAFICVIRTHTHIKYLPKLCVKFINYIWFSIRKTLPTNYLVTTSRTTTTTAICMQRYCTCDHFVVVIIIVVVVIVVVIHFLANSHQQFWCTFFRFWSVHSSRFIHLFIEECFTVETFISGQIKFS